MKNSKALFQQVIGSIDLKESPQEIMSITYFLLTSVFGITKTDILAGKMVPFPETTALALEKFVKKINTGQPVQYVIGEEYFYGRKFHVNPSVLIPRPETEGLIRAVMSYYANMPEAGNKEREMRILDIGTGSGCIPVTLYLEIPATIIFATDISNAALSVAVDNAGVHKANITFIEHNILTETIPVKDLDIITSNPPYVTEMEKESMEPNVLNYEPHQALFVPDNDPLIFYRELIQKSKAVLRPSGLLAVEINELYGREVADLFASGGFNEIQVIADTAGKDRVVSGVKS